MQKQLSVYFSKLYIKTITYNLIFLFGCVTPNSKIEIPADAKIEKPNKIAAPSVNKNGENNSLAIERTLAQIPKSAYEDNNEVEMPMSMVENNEKKIYTEAENKRRDFLAKRTDKEIIASQNQDENNAKEMGKIDKDLGLSPNINNKEIPSYTLGLQKIKDLYKEKSYEEALLEANDLLKYYPKSAILLMMKGTLLQKLNFLDNALISYKKAYDYDPSPKLLNQIEYLNLLINEKNVLKTKKNVVVMPADDIN